MSYLQNHHQRTLNLRERFSEIKIRNQSSATQKQKTEIRTKKSIQLTEFNRSQLKKNQRNQTVKQRNSFSVTVTLNIT